MKLCFRNVQKHYLKYTSVGNEMTFKGFAGTLRQAEYALDVHLHALDSIRSGETMSVDDVLQSACQFWCNLMSHYQSVCPKVQQQNKTHIHFC